MPYLPSNLRSMRPRAVYVVASQALIAAAAIGMPRVALGEDGGGERTLRVDYQADPACPDEETFVELARQRVRDWPPPSEHPSLVAHAVARRGAHGFDGRLVLEDSAGASLGIREIHEAKCDDVVLALALFLGVALEADAAEVSRAKRPVSPEPVVHSPSPARRPTRPTPPPEKAAESRLEGYVTGGVHGVSGRTPNVAAGLALGIEARVPTDARVVPSFGLAVDVAPYSTIDRGRGHVTFGWGALVATGCASFEHFRAPDREGQWEPWACARAEGGALRAASSGYEQNESAVKPWLGAGADVGVALWVTPRVAFTLGGGVTIPILRQSFVLSGISLFRVPVVAAELGLGMKVRAW